MVDILKAFWLLFLFYSMKYLDNIYYIYINTTFIQTSRQNVLESKKAAAAGKSRQQSK